MHFLLFQKPCKNSTVTCHFKSYNVELVLFFLAISFLDDHFIYTCCAVEMRLRTTTSIIASHESWTCGFGSPSSYSHTACIETREFDINWKSRKSSTPPHHQINLLEYGCSLASNNSICYISAVAFDKFWRLQSLTILCMSACQARYQFENTAWMHEKMIVCLVAQDTARERERDAPRTRE